jgi:hypothetical protein
MIFSIAAHITTTLGITKLNIKTHFMMIFGIAAYITTTLGITAPNI